MRRSVPALFLIVSFAAAQGAHPITGRRYAGVMSADGAPWLTRSTRETEEEPDKALAAIGIAKGSTVADIGAGSGYMTWRMAKLVGPGGKVYATTSSRRCSIC